MPVWKWGVLYMCLDGEKRLSAVAKTSVLVCNCGGQFLLLLFFYHCTPSCVREDGEWQTPIVGSPCLCGIIMEREMFRQGWHGLSGSLYFEGKALKIKSCVSVYCWYISSSYSIWLTFFKKKKKVKIHFRGENKNIMSNIWLKVKMTVTSAT